jgi:hypothetical protein
MGACAISMAALPILAAEAGFTDLFDGKTFTGWKLIGKQGQGYVVEDGAIVCPPGGGGNLFTEEEFDNFILRFEFKLKTGSNNGIGIRAPYDGDAAYVGMEIQVLDDGAAEYADLKPWQYHGSVYGIVPARRGHLRPTGEWNQEEIAAQGRRIKVTLNGQVIVDADLNEVKDPEVLQAHPGMLRDRGHIGFLGHDRYVAFRNIRIQKLAPPLAPDNQPPAGFQALFNGTDLSGWKGLVEDPPRRAKMSPAELTAAQAKADQRMRDHWKAVDGVLVFDGKGDNLCTARDYRDFELLVDWKIREKGDSGIYLRGSPQVQIWEPQSAGQGGTPVGSGGLYNNQKNPSKPAKLADRPVGQWNRFRILMTGPKVTVYLNDELVVHNVTMENYWERDKPIYPTGAIELQNHGNELFFKNIFVREIAR